MSKSSCWIAAGLCAVAVALMFAACGGQTTTVTKTVASPKSASVHVPLAPKAPSTDTAADVETSTNAGWGNCTASRTTNGPEDTCAYCQPLNARATKWVTNNDAETPCIPDPADAREYEPGTQDNVIPRCASTVAADCSMARWNTAVEVAEQQQPGTTTSSGATTNATGVSSNPTACLRADVDGVALGDALQAVQTSVTASTMQKLGETATTLRTDLGTLRGPISGPLSKSQGELENDVLAMSDLVTSVSDYNAVSTSAGVKEIKDAAAILKQDSVTTAIGSACGK